MAIRLDNEHLPYWANTSAIPCTPPTYTFRQIGWGRQWCRIEDVCRAANENIAHYGARTATYRSPQELINNFIRASTQAMSFDEKARQLSVLDCAFVGDGGRVAVSELRALSMRDSFQPRACSPVPSASQVYVPREWAEDVLALTLIGIVEVDWVAVKQPGWRSLFCTRVPNQTTIFNVREESAA